MSIKFRILGGVFGFGGGGGEMPILFLWARGFFGLHRTEKKSCRPQNRPKIGKKYYKKRIWALFTLCFVTFKMIENWGSVGGRRVLYPLVSPRFLLGW